MYENKKYNAFRLVKKKKYIYIYISNILSAFEDSGCGLFTYRKYEEYVSA